MFLPENTYYTDAVHVHKTAHVTLFPSSPLAFNILASLPDRHPYAENVSQINCFEHARLAVSIAPHV